MIFSKLGKIVHRHTLLSKFIRPPPNVRFVGIGLFYTDAQLQLFAFITFIINRKTSFNITIFVFSLYYDG